MSAWAIVNVLGQRHTMPIDERKMPTSNLTHAAFGHAPIIDCPCKPIVVLSSEHDIVFVNHRDVARGGCTKEGETYQ